MSQQFPDNSGGRAGSDSWLTFGIRSGESRWDNSIVDSASGTVTFLFTDIEGSTRLWQFDEGTMRIALAAARRSVAIGHSELGGTVFSTMGDGMAAAFPSAVAAVAAAVEVQTRLHTEPWATSRAHSSADRAPFR